MDTQLVSTIVEANALIDDLLDLQEAQQITIKKLLNKIQTYQSEVDGIYKQKFIEAVDSVSILTAETKTEVKERIRDKVALL